MKKHFTLIIVVLCSLQLNAALKEKNIPKGKKAQISCVNRLPSHFFCESEAFDIPGFCGHGFECVLMKIGEKQTACDTEFTCVEAATPKTGQ